MPSPFKRRTFLAGTGGVAAAGLLAACNSGGSGSGTAPVYGQPDVQPPAEYAGRKNIVVWLGWTGAIGESFAGVVKKFNDSQKDIYVEAQTFEGYQGTADKLIAGLQAKQVPELVVLSDTHWGRFFLNGALEPLKQYHGDGFKPDIWVDRFYKEGLIRDEQYWMSFARSTPLFYYNKDAFAAAGLPDKAPETWDEFRDMGKQLTGKTYNGNALKMRALTGGDDWYFSGLAWAFGGGYSKDLDVTLDSAETVAAAQFDRDTIFTDKSVYMAQNYQNDFVNGLVACITNSTGALTGLTKSVKFNLGTGFLPKAKNTGTPTGGGGLAILKNADPDRKQLAATFLKFLASDDVSAQWSVDTGYLPVTKAAIASQQLKDLQAKNPNYTVAINQLERAQGPDGVRRFVAATTTEVITQLQAIYSKDQDPKPLLTEGANKIREEAEKIQTKYDEMVK